MKRECQTDILIVGGGLGGIAGALAALRLGTKIVLTEETDWTGGGSFITDTLRAADRQRHYVGELASE